MPNRTTTPKKGRPTTQTLEQPTAPGDVSHATTGERASRQPVKPSSELSRAVAGWLADGRAQGWSKSTQTDRGHTLERFCWWLENEAGLPLVLSSLTPGTVRTFLAYTREGGSIATGNQPSERLDQPRSMPTSGRFVPSLTSVSTRV